jgi:hypothetical protein
MCMASPALGCNYPESNTLFNWQYYEGISLRERISKSGRQFDSQSWIEDWHLVIGWTSGKRLQYMHATFLVFHCYGIESAWFDQASYRALRSDLLFSINRFHLGKHKGTARCADPCCIEYVLQHDL